MTPRPEWTPRYHVTSERNWMNDPNGLVYYKGEYHLYVAWAAFVNGIRLIAPVLMTPGISRTFSRCALMTATRLSNSL